MWQESGILAEVEGLLRSMEPIKVVQLCCDGNFRLVLSMEERQDEIDILVKLQEAKLHIHLLIRHLGRED